MNYKIHLPDNYIAPHLPTRDEWTAALRSGKYNQTSESLCDSSGYCCLGVLSDVQGRLKYDQHRAYWLDSDLEHDDHENNLSNTNPLYEILKHNGEFPAGVWVKGWSEEDEETEENAETATSLVGCNDDLRLDFEEIAGIIEQIWQG
jgi:hypothetical protein